MKTVRLWGMPGIWIRGRVHGPRDSPWAPLRRPNGPKTVSRRRGGILDE